MSQIIIYNDDNGDPVLITPAPECIPGPNKSNEPDMSIILIAAASAVWNFQGIK
jgi:hypothetical protein